MPAECDGSAPSNWRLSGTFSSSASDIDFGDARVPFSLLTATASLGRFSTPRSGWSVSATGILDGSIEDRDLSNGGALGGSYTYLPMFETARRPFLALTANASAALARARADDGEQRSWTAIDLRIGVMVGKSLFDSKLIIYTSARAFGGPVFWQRAGERVTGDDRYHVTAGAGVNWNAAKRISVSVEVMPLGERSFAGGATWSL